MSKIPTFSNVVRRGVAGSKIAAVSMDRTVAQATAPTDNVGTGENRIQISTYFTKNGDTAILYNADRNWVRVTLRLETAGPVVVGQSADLRPVLSGKGQLLQTGVPAVFNVAKNNRLYIAANSVNRVSVALEPYPWLESITSLIGKITGTFGSVLGKIG